MPAASEPPLDVLYVLQDFPVRSERFVERELRGLLNLGARVRIIVLARGNAPDTSDWTGVSIWRPPRFGSFRFWAFWIRTLVAMAACPRSTAGLIARARTLRSEASRVRGFYAIRWLPIVAFGGAAMRGDLPSIIHAHFGSAPATVALLLGDWLDRPWGFSVHAHDFYAESIALSAKVDRAAHLFACSNTLADDVRRKLPTRLHAKVHTVLHGIDLDFWRSGGSPSTRETAVVLGVGRFEPKKGLEFLVEACVMLKNTGFAIRCDLIGDGPERERLAQLIATRGMRDVVCLLPWCTPEELQGHFRSASALAVPSVIAEDGDRDNIPNVVIEALACELPVVAAGQPALQAVLLPANAGLLFEPGDVAGLAERLRRVCLDAELRHELRKNGLRLVRERWDVRSTSQRIFGLLRSSSNTNSSGPKRFP